MPKVSPIQSSFNAGELSPRLAGRTDFDKYRAGCHKLENMMPLVQGPAERRPGTHFVYTTKTQPDRAWLVPFSFNAEQSYAIEMGDRYARFYTQRARLLSAGVPYEITTPYLVADLTNTYGSFRPSFVQSNDVVFWANSGYFPQMLERLAVTNWRFRSFGLTPGVGFRPSQVAFQFPFRSFNSDPGVTLRANAATGAINLNATTGAPFAPWMVGLYLLIQSDHGSTVAAWEPGKVVGLGDERRVDSRVYTCTTFGTTGSVRPTHTEGKRFDGDPGAQWQFTHAGSGVCLLTGYVSGAQMTGTVVMQIPGDCLGVANSTARFALQAWNSNDGYPTWCGFFRERLIWTRGPQLWLSQPGDFVNYAEFDANGDVTDESAISLTLSSPAAIRWGEETEQGLFLSTDDGEWIIAETNPSDPLSATNVHAKRQSRYGSSPMAGLQIGTAVLFAQRGGQKLREAMFAFQTSSFMSRNLAVLSDHVPKPGLIAMAFQQEPHAILWAGRKDGALVAFTYDREQDVYCWHRHPLGGRDVRVESVVAIPSPDGTRDDLWLIVSRTIQGATRRNVEYLEPGFETGDDIVNAWYVDAGLGYQGSVPITNLAGLDHLVGEEVYALADGAVQGPFTVGAGGTIMLTTAAARIIAGLNYRSVLDTMRRDEGAADGTAQGKTKRVHKLFARFLNTVGGKFGPNESELDSIPMRDSSVPMGEAIPAFTGDVELDYPGTYEKDARICIVQDQPLPMTVVALMPRLVEQD